MLKALAALLLLASAVAAFIAAPSLGVGEEARTRQLACANARFSAEMDARQGRLPHPGSVIAACQERDYWRTDILLIAVVLLVGGVGMAAIAIQRREAAANMLRRMIREEHDKATRDTGEPITETEARLRAWRRFHD